MSKIGWTDATWNPVTGCSAVSEGCTNCYAAKFTRRLENIGVPEYQGLLNERHFNGVVKCHDHKLEIPLRWRKPRMVFVNSMSDLFHEKVPDEFIDGVFAVMAISRQHSFQILTKRPERMAEYLNRDRVWDDWADNMPGADAWEKRDRQDRLPEPFGNQWPLPNVWLGTSCEDQNTLDERVPHLLNCPTAVRFLSLEPLLGPIVIPDVVVLGPKDKPDHIWFDPLRPNNSLGISWVIVGCESGHKRRPCRWDWMESIVGQCRDAGVPVFVKQLAPPNGSGKIHKHTPGGDWPAWVPASLRVQEFPK